MWLCHYLSRRIKGQSIWHIVGAPWGLLLFPWWVLWGSPGVELLQTITLLCNHLLPWTPWGEAGWRGVSAFLPPGTRDGSSYWPKESLGSGTESGELVSLWERLWGKPAKPKPVSSLSISELWLVKKHAAAREIGSFSPCSGEWFGRRLCVGGWKWALRREKDAGGILGLRYCPKVV